MIINAAPKARNNTQLSGVAIPRNTIAPPTIYKTFGIPNNCFTKVPEKSAAFEPFVTRIPVERDIKSEGICDTRPSPIVRIPNC